jgi:DNA-damage-inducible protein J
MVMGKTGYITARVEPKLKASAGKVLNKVGVSTSDAITMFLKQVVLQGGLPFEVRAPNARSRKAIEELEAGRGETFHGGTKEAFEKELGRRKKRSA